MNIVNMKKLIGQLERLPDEKFYMGAWIVHPEDFDALEVRRPKSCGTVGCIAGWAWLANNKATCTDDSNVDSFEWAKDWLDLGRQKAQALFYGHWAYFKIKNGRAWPMEKITRADAIAELKRLLAEAQG